MVLQNEGVIVDCFYLFREFYVPFVRTTMTGSFFILFLIYYTVVGLYLTKNLIVSGGWFGLVS